MTPEDRIVLACARQAFGPPQQALIGALARRHAIRWDRVAATAIQHQIGPLVCRNLAAGSPYGMPGTVLNQLKRCQIESMLTKRNVRRTLEQALALLGAHAIPVMIVKGEALNLMVYHQPWYTVSGDIDIVLRPSRAAIAAAGQTAVIEALDRLGRDRSGFERHIEYDFGLHHDCTLNGALTVDPDGVWKAARPIAMNGHPACVMDPADLLIAAAVGACRKRFFRLKMLCDVAETLAAFPDLDWAAVADRARACQADGILYAGLSLCRSLLGADVPPALTARLRPGRARVAAIESLVYTLPRAASITRLDGPIGEDQAARPFTWPVLLVYAAFHRRQIQHMLGLRAARKAAV